MDPRQRIRPALCALLLGPAALVACQARSPGDAASAGGFDGVTVLPDVPVSQPPYDRVHVQWKQRLPQAYVFVELRGSYTAIGDALEEVFGEARAQGLEVTGAPFALYYDDPARTPANELRARACLPVSGGAPRAPLTGAVLEATTVVYAFVGGAYPDVPRAYPALFEYMQRLGWVEAGPIRESYLVNPGQVEDWADLVCEVQIPAASGR
jgi:effector-binding domain-containing protein